MENKKYELLENDTIVINDGKTTLYRIRAIKDFGDVKSGDLGGYIESEDNLSIREICWIYDNAWVYDNARVFGDAKVYNNAKIYGNAWVYDNARVYGYTRVSGVARVSGNDYTKCVKSIHD